MVTENKIEAYLVHLVRSNNGMTIKTQGGYVRPGWPDRLVLLNGKIFLIELKKETGRLSPLQRHTIEEIKRTGNTVYVLYSMEDVEEFIRTNI